MMELFGRKRVIAMMMVAIMLFTLLPVDLNWADEASVIQEAEEVTTEVSTTETVREEMSSEESIESIVIEDSTEVLAELSTEEILTDVIQQATKEESTETFDGISAQRSLVMEVEDVKADKATQSGSLNQYITAVMIYDKDNQGTIVEEGMGDITLGGTDNFTIRYDFAIPNASQNYKEGSVIDTYIPTEYCTFANPDTLYDLKDADGTVIAQFSVNTDGRVVITFTKEVEGKSEVSGYFYVGCKLNAENVEDEGTIEIDLNIANVPVIPITVNNSTPGETEASITKATEWSVPFGWNISLNPGDEDVAGMIIKDTLVGQVLDGDVTFGGVVMQEGVDYTFDAATGEFVFTVPMDITNTTSLIIPTKPKAESLAAEDSSQEIKNTASLYGTDNTKKSDSNTASRWLTTDWVNKSYSYDETNKTITWIIKVNNNNLDVENAKVKDSFLEEYKDFEIVGLTINGVSQSVTAGDNPFPLSLGDIDSQQIITFTVQKTDGSIPTGSIANTATFVGDGVPADAVDEAIFTKTVNYISKSGQYNQATGKVDWTIVVNSDMTTITNPEFQDTLPTGLTYVKDSFTVNGTSQTPTVNGQMITYNFTSEKTDDKISKSYTIQFSTSVGSVVNNETVSFTNKASLTGDEVPADTTADATVSFTPSLFKKVCNQWYGQNDNGGDYGGDAYDVSSHKIKWKLSVNESMIDMGEGVSITDTLDASQTFLGEDGDVVVYKYVNGSPVAVEGVVTYAYNNDTNQITFTFSGFVTDRYSIIYKTQILDDAMPQPGEEKTYSNSATISYDNKTETSSATSPKVTGYTVDKKGTILSNTNTENGDGAVLKWELDINKNQVLIPEGVITDTLQKGTTLIEDSIVLQELNADEYGNWNVGSVVDANTYSYTYNTTTRTFTFNMPKDSAKAYRLCFNTKVVDTTVTSVSNTAKFKGTSPTLSNQSTVNGIDTSLIGGGITIAEGKLIVIKVDENDQAKVLEGAVFEVRDDNGNVYTSDPTDENGITIYDSLKLDTQYYLKETVAPAGYELSTEEYAFEIATGTTDNTITYYYKDAKVSENGSISVNKYDNSSPAKPLQGATFTLYDESKTDVIDVQESKSNGVATFNNVPYGTYVLVETKAPSGYIMNSSAFEETVIVDATNKNLTFDVYNTKEAGVITVYKKDDNSTESERIPLQGAEFTLYCANSGATSENGESTMSVYATAVTDSAGKVTFADLPYGTYYLQETKAPDGYEITDSSLKTIVVNSNDTTKYTYTYTNKKIVADIKVKKTDKSTGVALAGAVFGLYNSTGNLLLDTQTSGADGYVLFEDLEAGTYIVKEISPPDKYNGTSVVLSVAVTESKTYVYDTTFKNEEQQGEFSFKKIDSETKVGLQGAVFTLYDTMGNEVASATSDEDGVVTFTDLAFGIYKLVETTAPTGYYRNVQEVSVTVESNVAFTIDDVGNDSIPTTPPHIAVKVKKVETETAAAVPGATIGLYKQEPGEEKVLVTSVVTDNDGVAYFEKVYIEGDAVGTKYSLKEIAAPAGYLLAETEITLGKKYADAADAETDNISQYAYDENWSDKFNSTKESGQIENTPIKGRVVLNKKDAASVDTGLADAEFTFYTDKECNTVATDIGTNGVVTTDLTGVAAVSDVPYGTYYIKETKAPSGYVASSLVQKIEVKEDYATSNISYSYTILNQKIKGKIQITKRDSATAAVLKGATFALCNSSGGEVSPSVRATTNANGIATFNDLDIGTTYYFKEIVAPVGYKLSGDVKTVTAAAFTEANSYVVYQSVTNEAIVASATIQKTDDDSNPLANAEFTLYSADGVAIESKFTNTSGVATFTNIPVGNYYICETKAPTGYVLDNTKHTISSTDFGDGTTAVSFTFESVNQKMAARIRIVKRDSVNATPLSGAVFSLHDDTGKELDRQTTGVDGVVTFNVAAYGNYTVKEVSAPTGYLIVENTYNFTVDSNSSYSSVVVNEKIKGNIAVKKVNIQGEPLDNAEFTLYKEDGVTAVTTVTNPVTTNMQGEARFENLDAGTYYVKETRSPEGYIMKGILYKIVIDGAQGNQVDYPITISNEKNPSAKFADIHLTKTETGNANILVAGAEYTLYKDGRPMQVQVTDENGNLEFKDIPYGTGYVIRETKAPEGYHLLAEDIVLTIDETTVSASGVLTVDTSDAPITGKLTLYKVDVADTSVKLSGAEFQILQGDTVIDTQTTNAEGVIVFDNLKPGEYQVKEITAPDGYTLLEQVTNVTIKLDALEQTVTISNEKTSEIIGKITLTKVDKDNQKKKLKGAVFELVSGDVVIATSKSDKNGLVVFKDIPEGEYIVREKKAPTGYKKSKKTIKVTVKAAKEYNLGKFTNKEKSSDESITSTSKKTSDGAPLQGILSLFLFSLIGVAGSMHYKKKYKE